MELSPYRITDKTVRAYWNSHRHLYSVQHQVDKQWRLLTYATRITLADVKFIVNPKGSQRVKETNAKNVHAYVEGQWVFIDHAAQKQSAGTKYFGIDLLKEHCKCGNKDCIGKVMYDPRKHKNFMDVQTKTPITEAPFCSLEIWFSYTTKEDPVDFDLIYQPEKVNYKLPKTFIADVYAVEHL